LSYNDFVALRQPHCARESMPATNLILASTSRYRRELLTRLAVPFETVQPGVDETARPGESPTDLAVRLAREKASAVAARFPTAIVIGADQVAVLEGRILGKPLTHENATAQLRAARGKRVSFLTAVALVQRTPDRAATRLVPCHVEFRAYSDPMIESYLRAEQPYDCAGAAKIEGLGITLVKRLEGDDPTALIGLPLIALVEMLGDFGFEVLRES
jgi:septum formation protein